MTPMKKVHVLANPGVPVWELSRATGGIHADQGGPRSGSPRQSDDTFFQRHWWAKLGPGDPAASAIEDISQVHLSEVQKKQIPSGRIVIRHPTLIWVATRWGRTEECYGEDPYFNGTMWSLL